MKIVFLDRNTVGEDLDISAFEKYGTLTVYPFTTEEEIPQRIADADIIITNKSRLNSRTLPGSPVKLICITATGTDNVEIPYCAASGIAVCNVRGYSTESVVQHTFTLLFSLMEKLPLYHEYTASKGYLDDTSFRHLGWRFHEISGKRYGIIGMGAIGSRVADIAKTFGCDVVYWSSHNQDRSAGYQRLDFDELLATCDIISIHSPLTPQTYHLFGKEQFQKMKEGAILINVGRGDILIEEDLTAALENNWIGGAAIDVLSREPMDQQCPFLRVLGRPDFIMTPHIAWAAIEARERCMEEIGLNMESFFRGEMRNRVDITASGIL